MSPATAAAAASAIRRTSVASPRSAATPPTSSDELAVDDEADERAGLEEDQRRDGEVDPSPERPRRVGERAGQVGDGDGPAAIATASPRPAIARRQGRRAVSAAACTIAPMVAAPGRPRKRAWSRH